MASYCVSACQWVSPFFNETCSVILSVLQRRHWAATSSRLLWFFWLGCIFSRWQHNWEDSRMCNKDDFQPALAWKLISKKRLRRSMGCIALRNTGVFFCFQKGILVLWCFNTPKKRRVKMKEKKQNFISQAHWRARLLCTSTTAAFSGVAKQRLKLGDMF